MELQFSGQYDKAAYFRAVQWAVRPSRRTWIIRIGLFVLFLALYIGLVVTASGKEDLTTLDMGRLLRHLITLLLLAYVVFKPYIDGYLVSNRLWNDPFVQRKITGRISSMGVQIDPDKQWMAWDSFIKFHQWPDAMVLLTTDRLFVLLPRAFFQSEADWQMAQELVTGRVQTVIE